MDKNGGPQDSGVRAAKGLLAGFSAMAGGSFAVMGVQFAAATLSARLLPATAFGAYAVAVSGVSLLGVLGGISLGQAAARRATSHPRGDQNLVTIATLSGLVTAAAAFLLAPAWSDFWAIPEAVAVTRVVALGLPFQGASFVLAGVLRRTGQASSAAARWSVAQIVSVLTGLLVVWSTRSTWALGVSNVLGFMLPLLLYAAALPRGHWSLTLPRRHELVDGVFAGKASALNAARVFVNQAPGWAIGRFVGPSILGTYNRSTTLVTVPLDAIQRALGFSLYPLLGPAGGLAKRRTAFTDVMIIVSSLSLVLLGLAPLAAGPFIEIVLGPGWEQAGVIAGLAAVVGVVPLTTMPLNQRLEALGHFRALSAISLLSLAPLGLGILGTAWRGSALPAQCGIVGFLVVQGGATLQVLHARGLLDLKSLLIGVLPVGVTQLLISGVIVISFQLVPGNSPLSRLAIVVSVAGVEGAGMWINRRRIHAYRVAQRYGLL